MGRELRICVTPSSGDRGELAVDDESEADPAAEQLDRELRVGAVSGEFVGHLAERLATPQRFDCAGLLSADRLDGYVEAPPVDEHPIFAVD